MHVPRTLRRLAAAVVVPVLALIGVIGISPTAAADSTSLTVSIEIIKENNIKVKIEFTNSYITRSTCEDRSSFKNLDSDVDLKSDYDSKNSKCTLTANNLSISQYNRNFIGEIEHEGKKYTYTDGYSSLSDYDSAEVSVTFPGKVSSVSGDGKKSGNTATWKHAEKETKDLKATGADHSTPYIAIILVVVVLLAVAGGVSFYVFVVRKKKQQQAAFPGAPMMNPGMAPGYPQPGQPGYAQPGPTDYPQSGQPGYAQPGQGYAQPGQGYAQPGQPGQPGYAQPGPTDYPQPGQPGYAQPGQPGQQPYYPNGQY